jgi:hypothetical protein
VQRHEPGLIAELTGYHLAALTPKSDQATANIGDDQPARCQLLNPGCRNAVHSAGGDDPFKGCVLGCAPGTVAGQ